MHISYCVPGASDVKMPSTPRPVRNNPSKGGSKVGDTHMLYHGDTGKAFLTPSRLVVRKRLSGQVDIGGGWRRKGAGGAGKQLGRGSYCQAEEFLIAFQWGVFEGSEVGE